MSVATRAPAPRQKTLRRLVEALESLLAEGEDFTALPVERLLSRADVARSTFYAHFEGKGALLRDVGSDVVTSVLEANNGWSELPPDAGRADLRAAFANLLDTYRRHRVLMGAMAEVATYDPEVRTEFGRLVVEGQAALTRHVRRGQADGSVRADVDPVMTVTWLFWMVERCLYTQVRTCKPADVPRHVDALTGIVWATLYEGTATRT